MMAHRGGGSDEQGAGPDEVDPKAPPRPPQLESHELPTSVDAALGEASTHAVRVELDAEQRTRVAEAQVTRLETAADQARDDRDLRKSMAPAIRTATFIQVGVADLVFVIYGFWNGWHIPGGAIQAWLAATVVQVIAMALVIIRSLFPDRTRKLRPGEDETSEQ